MSNQQKMLLQLFADGGSGGASAAAGAQAGGTAATGDTGNDATTSANGAAAVPAFIPEKARAIYQKAMKRTSATQENAGSEARAAVPDTKDQPPADKPAAKEPGTKDVTAKETDKTRKSYAELIKDPFYKEEHTRYMEATIRERLKGANARQESLAKQNAEMQEILATVATKYGLDPNSEAFLQELKRATGEDDSFYEAYAAEHDMSSAEARRTVELERRLAATEREVQARRDAEQQAAAVDSLRESGAKTKALYPDFDLDFEMKDPRFVRIVAATGGDTTAAYFATHHKELVSGAVQKASEEAARATMNSVRAGMARPTENGVSNTPPAARAEVDYSKMNLQQIRAEADRLRRERG